MHQITLSPDVARLSLSPDTTLSPSPPLSATAATGNRKPPGIRARRLRLSQTNSEHLPAFSSVGHCCATAGDTDLQRVRQLTLTAHIPQPPQTSSLGKGLKDSWYGIIKCYFYIPVYMYSYSIKNHRLDSV